jgi:hypothetical protein
MASGPTTLVAGPCLPLLAARRRESATQPCQKGTADADARKTAMTACVKCEGQAQLYLCPHCIIELRHQLLGLPTMLTYLYDAAVGNTKMSDNTEWLRSSENVAVHYNPRATRLLEDIYDTLGQWARSLARTHHLLISPPVNWLKPVGEYKHGSKDYAMFLAANVHRLAADPDILELCVSLRRYIKKAVGDDRTDTGGLVNRKEPEQFCGPCPALIIDHRNCGDTCGRHQHDCGTRLFTKRGAIEVVCPGCGATHQVENLVNHLLARAEHFRCTINEMFKVLRMLNEPVTLKTLYRWTYEGKLKPAGYLRADRKNIGITRHSDTDKPVYRVSDARKQRAEKPREATKKVKNG